MESLRTLAFKATGVSIEALRAELVADTRQRVETQFGRPMTITLQGKAISSQPGCGLETNEQIKRDLDKRLAQ